MSNLPVPLTPPKSLQFLFENPALVGDENRKDYDALFSGFADVIKPSDVILWVLMDSIVQLAWSIRRDRQVKANVINLAQAHAVKEALSEIRAGGFLSIKLDKTDEADSARRWATDPAERKKINKELLNAGYDAHYIQADAHINSAAGIDAVDKRIASAEARFIAVLKEIERYSLSLAERTKLAAMEIIEGEYSEAEE